MPKKRFRSYQDAEDAYVAAEHQRTLLDRAVRALVSKPHELLWLQARKPLAYRIGLLHLTGAEGGIVIVQERKSKAVTVQRLDEWGDRVSRILGLEPETLELRELLDKARVARQRAYDTERALAGRPLDPGHDPITSP